MTSTIMTGRTSRALRALPGTAAAGRWRRRAATAGLALAVFGVLGAPTAAWAQQTRSWDWKGTLGSGRTVYLRNVNGEVRIEPGTGSTVEVHAEKRWRRGDPDDVRIEARQLGSSGDVIICALWTERATGDEDGYHGNQDRGWRDRDNDVSVQFVVKVPVSARVDASTVNGGLAISGISGDIAAHTVNGDVEAGSTGGRVEAKTVNGSITVRTVAGGTAGDLEYSTVNGSITIEMSEGTNADVNLSTVNGRIASDFPLTLEGNINPRRIRAKLGNGGPSIRATTVNGGIRLRKL